MHVHDPHRSFVSSGAHGAATDAAAHAGHENAARTAPLRVDAQRNLEHVLRAAREVFGELGYGAPMEDVARRARVGVGTVYRRFPSKDVLVRRIAAEETARLTEQARSALEQESRAFMALSRFLRLAVASGAGRLLPPEVLRVGVVKDDPRVGEPLPPPRRSTGGLRTPAAAAAPGVPRGPGSLPVHPGVPAAGTAALLEVVGRLVERARSAGELRPDVSVSDVLLVMATPAPTLPDPARQTAASGRLLDILLDGLRSRSGPPTTRASTVG
ncbi:TetR family transcriptional regulator [Streptomyces sp. ZYX-F-203]